MLTRHELHELYDEGPAAVVRVIAELYDYIAANEPPLVRRQRMSIEALAELVRKLKARREARGRPVGESRVREVSAHTAHHRVGSAGRQRRPRGCPRFA